MGGERMEIRRATNKKIMVREIKVKMETMEKIVRLERTPRKLKKKKNGNKVEKSENERKFVKKPNTETSAENAAKPNRRLNKLGFTKMPTKSTLEGLNCMWNKLEDLLVKCGEKSFQKLHELSK